MASSSKILCALYSDLHIKHPNDPIYKEFIDSLANLPKSVSYIFILGDLFNFLYGNVDWIVVRYQKLFDTLRELSKSGVKIYYVFGNHDFSFRFNSLDFLNIADSFILEINNKKLLLKHGDGLDDSDMLYKILKGFLRSKLFFLIYKIFPCSITYRIANILGVISRFLGRDQIKNKEYIKDLYKKQAIRLAKENNVDIIVLGHSHISDRAKDGGIEYINTGEFLKDGVGFLEL